LPVITEKVNAILSQWHSCMRYNCPSFDSNDWQHADCSKICQLEQVSSASITNGFSSKV